MTRPDPSCVVKVGGGRGFIYEQRISTKGLLKRGTGLRLRPFIEIRRIVTAAHCLPKLPPAHAASLWHERTYRKLLGSLDSSKNEIAAECQSVDPIADIAVLGRPDGQEPELYEDATAYDELVDNAPALLIAEARSGPGWVLALDKPRWVRTTLCIIVGNYGVSLEMGPNEPGMSGSPILNDAGRAVGIVSVGEESDGKNERSAQQPILLRDLPRRMLA
jgi:hypothetical protein